MTDAYYFDPRVAEAYDDSHSESVTVDDIPFYVGLAREAAARGESVLELGCGTGRVTIPIAQTGVSIVGMDNAPPMLEVARRKSAGIDNVGWVLADMASFELPQRFGLAIIPFRSFLLLLTVAEQKSCLACIREHLLPGGRLALNFFNPDLRLMGRRLAQRGNRMRRQEERDGPEGSRLQRWERSDYDLIEQAVDWTQRVDQLSDEGAVITRVEKTLRLRYVFRYEMEHLLALCGFEVEALCGWFDRRPFDAASSEMVWLARRP